MKEFGRIFHNPKLQFAEATATLVGSIVGVGILGMPYAVSKVGFIPGLLMLIALTLVNIVLLLMFSEVTLRTRGNHEIPGYGGLYLGASTKLIAFLIGIIGGYGVMLVQIIAQGYIVQALFGGSATAWSLTFFIIAGYIIYRGVEAVRVIELLMTLAISVIFFLIGLTAQPHVDTQNLIYTPSRDFIIPYGVILFALSGTSVIPQIREQMQKFERRMPLVILAANLIIFVMYAGFLWLVLGVTGAHTTQIATIGLGNKVGSIMRVLGNGLAMFTISTSFITIGLSMRRVFQYDYQFPRFKAWLTAMAIPLTLFVLGARNFIGILGIVGGVILGIQNIIVITSYWKAQKDGTRRPEFTMGRMSLAGVILIGVYSVGAILTILGAF
ncbi:hypothetical protein A3D08_01250 [Candidatus Roizmanbacteria bacterium RIFCSPHIGHO2_02_FULL_43_11]|uniref:Amino acid transporter transmembrane domain-containing protein n=1 Tax=Candidatus Roizmanbacteria bacterium RIFCSPHIGHO2_02_FULL_43_11 TaxID=1802043 RepID=A0A1F7HE96_9BACT|nr:MAG: hypothetical protein A3D08_01250 [Candidatus Roizmanbacteria bacterium RIFCSPHIGHO2_02_FULL_43_11]